MAHCQVITMKAGISQSQYLFNQGNIIDYKCFIIHYANGYIYNNYCICRKLRQLVETLEILTGVPYSTEECQLYGEGTLDEKYHTPGV